MALIPAPMALHALDSAVTIRALTSFYSMPIADWHWGGVVEGALDLAAKRNPVVRGQLQLKATLLTNNLPTPAATLSILCSGERAVGRLCVDIPRANIRFRIPLTADYRLRFTIGRARLTWGQGQVFNAGDLLFGAVSDRADYTQSVVRDETAILVAAFIPLTRFSFIEVVALPPLSALTPPSLAAGAAGLRLQGKIADWQYEFGYLYNGGTVAHNVALNVQGYIGIDFYLSATSAFVHSADLAAELYQRLQITLGLYHVFALPNDLSLSVRLESLVSPAGAWQQTERSDGSPVRYALLLYPEAVLSISNALQFFVRSNFSPIDLSAQVIGGVTWVPYSGLSILFFPTIAVGEETDTFHIDQTGGLNFTIGAQYTF